MRDSYVRWAALIMLVVACAKTSPAPLTPGSGQASAPQAPLPSNAPGVVATEVASCSALSPQANELPTCPCPCDATPLEKLPLAHGVHYMADVQYDKVGAHWQPSSFPTMPHNHASHIEWTGLERFAPLDPSLRLRFYGVVGTEEEISRVPGRQEWRAIYRVQVECVCVHQ